MIQATQDRHGVVITHDDGNSHSVQCPNQQIPELIRQLSKHLSKCSLKITPPPQDLPQSEPVFALFYDHRYMGDINAKNSDDAVDKAPSVFKLLNEQVTIEAIER